jgi:hypothetical protein
MCAATKFVVSFDLDARCTWKFVAAKAVTLQISDCYQTVTRLLPDMHIPRIPLNMNHVEKRYCKYKLYVMYYF